MCFSLRDLLHAFPSSLLCSLITLGVLILIAKMTPRTQIIYSHGTVLIIGKGSNTTISTIFKMSEDFMSMFLCIPIAGLNETCFFSTPQTTTIVCAKHFITKKPKDCSLSRSLVVSWSYRHIIVTWSGRLNSQMCLAPLKPSTNYKSNYN